MANINPNAAPLPLNSPPQLAGDDWTGQLTVAPPANTVNSAFYQAYFPPPFGTTMAPPQANVTIGAAAAHPQPGDPVFGGTYTPPGGWAAQAFLAPLGNCEMAFTVVKTPGQNWPNPMLVTINITGGYGEGA